MKKLLIGFAAAFLTAAVVADANAVTCAEGVRRAGCEGPRGAVEVRKPVPVAAEVPHKEVVVEPAKEVVVTPPKEVVVTPHKEVEVAPARGCVMVEGRRVCR